MLVLFGTYVSVAAATSQQVGSLFYKLNATGKTAQLVKSDSYNTLTAVTVPAAVTVDGVEYQVTSVESSAFISCKSLKIVEWQATAPIPGNCFRSCDSLMTVNIAEGVTELSAHCLSICPMLEHIKLPSTLTFVGNSAFYLSGLKSVELPPSVLTIEGGAFSSCKALETVKLGKNLPIINASTFSGCTSLKTIEIPESVKTIASQAFYNCTSLKSIVLHHVKNINYRAFMNCTSLDAIEVGDSLETLGEQCFTSTKFKELTLPPTFKTFNNNVLGLTSIKRINISDLKAWCRINFQSKSSSNVPSGNNLSGKTLYLNGEMVKDLAFPADLTEISGGAFASYDSLKSVTFHDAMAVIGPHAFSGCRNLSVVKMGKGIKKLDECAFANAGITEVHISDIKAWCDVDIVSYYDAGSNPIFEARKFYNKNRLMRRLTIPDGVTKIKPNVFRGCESLTSVVLPESVDTIGAYAFSSCSNITSFKMGDKVRLIDEYALNNNSSLTEIHLSNVLETIGRNAFSKTSLESIHLPATLKSIGRDAFNNVPLKKTEIDDVAAWCKVTFGLGDRSIPSNPILNSKNLYLKGRPLRHLVLPDEMTKVGDYSFYCDTMLVSVVVGDVIRPLTGKYTFYGCTNLESVTLGLLTDQIGANFFDNCTKINRVHSKYDDPPMVVSNSFDSSIYPNATLIVPTGSMDLYQADEVWSKFGKIEEGTRYFISDGIGYIKFPVVHGPLMPGSKERVKVISASDLSDDEWPEYSPYSVKPLSASVKASEGNNRTRIVIPETVGEDVIVAAIGEAAFQTRPDLRYIQLPATVDTICPQAFQWCDNLEEVVNLNPVPQNIDENVFADTTYTTATLFVPEGKVEDYRAHSVWGKFGNIMEYGVASIGAVESEQPWVFDGEEFSFGSEMMGRTLRVFDLEGRCMIEHTIADASASLSLAGLKSGIYIATVDGHSAKIYVK